MRQEIHACKWGWNRSIVIYDINSNSSECTRKCLQIVLAKKHEMLYKSYADLTTLPTGRQDPTIFFASVFQVTTQLPRRFPFPSKVSAMVSSCEAGTDLASSEGKTSSSANCHVANGRVVSVRKFVSYTYTESVGHRSSTRERSLTLVTLVWSLQFAVTNSSPLVPPFSIGSIRRRVVT